LVYDATDFSRFTAAWDITKACNFACVHCISGAGRKWPVYTIPTKKAKYIIQEIGNLGITSVAWSGGEPLLRDDLSSIMSHGLKFGIKSFSMVTNGYLINKELIQRLVDSGLTNVQISLDGEDEKQNRILRKGPADCFSKAIKAIGICLDAGLNVSLGVMLYPQIIYSLDNMYNMALNLNVDRLRFSAFVPNGRGDNERIRRLFDFSFREITELLLFLRDRYFEKPGFIALDTAFSLNPYIGSFYHNEGIDYFFIDYKGDIFPSTSMERQVYKVGNVLQEPLNEILIKPILVPKSPPWTKIIGICKNCDKFEECHGGPRGICYMFSGKFNCSPNFCLYHEFKKREELLGDIVVSKFFSSLSNEELRTVLKIIDEVDMM
jgi:radical SAM protein with 4Fe4S-binding SPASM domain